MRKIMIVVLLVWQLQHGFTKNAKVSPNLTVAHMSSIYLLHFKLFFLTTYLSIILKIYYLLVYHFMSPFANHIICYVYKLLFDNDY